jgi:hypothetical protein
VEMRQRPARQWLPAWRFGVKRCSVQGLLKHH